jgi:hypothetical protein
VTCGEVFLRPLATARFCSRECYIISRLGVPKKTTGATSQARRLTKTEAAWLAGLFDGEGSIIFVHKDRPTPSVRITISNTYYPLLLRIQEVTGVGRLIVHHRAGTGNPKHSASWNWQTYSANARDLLQQMLPWLIVKREKADAALNR